MNMTFSGASRPNRNKLARAVGLALVAGSFGLVVPPFAAVAGDDTGRPAMTYHVGNCADDGSLGTLRNMLAASYLESGDTLDVSACGTIQLQAPLIVEPANLVLRGGPTGYTTLTTHADDRLVSHMGTGTLTFERIILTNGYRIGEPVRGGCVSSLGSLELRSSWVTGCTVVRESGTGAVRGGGLFAQGDITLDDAVVWVNSVATYDGGDALGGGIYAHGKTTVRNGSEVMDNEAFVMTGNTSQAKGGGVFSLGAASVTDSVVTGNKVEAPAGILGATNAFGGGLHQAEGASGSLLITRSVISGNTAVRGAGGGVAADARTTIVFRSAIDGNTAKEAGGILFDGGGRLLSVLDSRINENTASKYGGGLVAKSGSVTISGTTVDSNEAESVGGVGIADQARTVKISNSTVSRNWASDGIGGVSINHDGSGSIEIEQSTIIFNGAGWVDASAFRGAGLRLRKSATIRNSTVYWNWVETENTGFTGGAGIFLDPGVALELSSSIVSDSRALGPTTSHFSNVGQSSGSGASVDGTHNIVGESQIPMGHMVGTNLFSDGVLLEPLQDNGARTWTAVPRAGSLPVDAGLANGFATDQRGAGYPRVIGAAADIGAVEHDPDRIFFSGFEGTTVVLLRPAPH